MSNGNAAESAPGRRIAPLWAGALGGLGGALAIALVLVLAVAVSGLDLTLAEPTFETLAQVAAALLVAFSVELAAIVMRAGERPGRLPEAWIGYAVGVGAGGLVGVGTAIGGAEWSRDVFDQTTTGDTLATASLTLTALLGAMVLLLPLIASQRLGPASAPGPDR